VKELQKVMECAPKRVFVEMARGEQGNQKDKRRDSRKKQLIDLYKKCKEEERDWIEELNKNEDQQLRSDKLYLYY
jgi:CRISPR-associated endonuclease Csn1